MERRRANKIDEVQMLWAKSTQSLATLQAAHLAANEKITHVNEILANLPQTPHTTEIKRDISTTELVSLKSTYKKLHGGLTTIKSTAEDELKAISDALESVSVLLALKRSPDQPSQEKRAKRSRISSPALGSRTGTPAATPPPQAHLTLSVPARANVAGGGFSREPKARREALAGQLPLKEGRKVAFRPPPNKVSSDGKNKPDDGVEENAWILAVVKRCINQDKNRYEVTDAEDPNLSYNTTLRALIPLPDPSAPPGSIIHPSSYEEFPKGSIVMAQYPDTTTFYRAEVLVGPKDSHNPKNGTVSKNTVYRLKFDDDDDQVRIVQAHLVVEWPGDV